MSETKVCNYCGLEKPLSEFLWQKGKSIRTCYSCKNKKARDKRRKIENGTYERTRDLHFRAQKFLADAEAVHGDKYDYSKVCYKNSKDNVEIICKEHNISFHQSPLNHLAGKRCPECAKAVSKAKRTHTTAEFVAKAEAIHKSKYNYRLVDYKGNDTLVNIECNTCGDVFPQMPATHLRGSGCPSCANYGYRRSLPGYVYVMVNDEMTKIGITNRTPDERLKGISKRKKGFSVLMCKFFQDGDIAWCVEHAMKIYLKHTAEPVQEKFDGSTECFLNVNRPELINMVNMLGQIMEEQYGNN